MSEGKEFRVTMQLRNNRMLELREAKGWTQAEAAMACLISQGAWGGLETLREKPTVWAGGPRSKTRLRVWSGVALAIAEAFDVTPEWLWPDEVQAVAGGKKSLKVGADEAMALMGEVDERPPELMPMAGELRLKARKVLATLTPREEKVLRMRFGIGENDHTYEEIAKDFEITRERARQIGQNALRKLRHPSVAREFAPIVADEGRRPLRDGEVPIANRMKGLL